MHWEDPHFETQNLALYAEEAEYRVKLLAGSGVSYRLLITLSDSIKEGFSGVFEARFSLQERPTVENPLFLDFQGKQISKLRINGNKILDKAAVRFERHRIFLPTDLLLIESANTVQFEFNNSYVSNCSGLHFYKDPKDQRVYIYSHLEPFYCHRFFPCFDQPSVRA